MIIQVKERQRKEDLPVSSQTVDICFRSQRISDVESAQFRDYLKKRTVSDARKLAEKDGLILTRKQASNQVKYSEDAITGKTGPKISFTEADIRDLDRFAPSGLKTSFSTDGNILDFTAMKTNEDQIRMFLSVSPRKEEIKRWQNHVENILKSDLDQKKKLITELSGETSAGFKFSNRMFIDTTFNIGHLYLTQLLGETKSFRLAFNTFISHSPVSGQNRAGKCGLLL